MFLTHHIQLVYARNCQYTLFFLPNFATRSKVNHISKCMSEVCVWEVPPLTQAPKLQISGNFTTTYKRKYLRNETRHRHIGKCSCSCSFSSSYIFSRIFFNFVPESAQNSSRILTQCAEAGHHVATCIMSRNYSFS